MKPIPESAKAALDLLAARGVDVYETPRQAALDCGCTATLAWRTDTYEPCVTFRACSHDHDAATERVRASWDDPLVAAKYGLWEAQDSAIQLLREELTR